MAQEITLYGDTSKVQLPAYLQQRYGQQTSIITESRGASLSIRAKKFTLNVGGESTVIQRPDPDSGDMVPVGVLPVIILDYAVAMGRSYYGTSFDPDVTSQPDCWSLDGKVPEPEVVDKQAVRCAGCPKSVKGSKMADDGVTPLVACGVHRILSVVPARALKMQPLSLRIAQTSDYDGKNVEARQNNYFAFKQYLEALKTRGFPSTRAVVTNLSFDQTARVSYPKLFFRPQRWVTEEEAAAVDEIMQSGQVRTMMTWTGTEAALAGENVRPEADPAAVERVAARTSSAQDGRFAEAESALGAQVQTPKAEASKAQTAKADTPKSETPKAAPAAAQGGGFPDPEPVQNAGEDEDDFQIRRSGWNKKRKAWEAQQAEAKAAAAKTTAAAAAPSGEFKFRAMEDGEDEDDYNIAKSTARKAWARAGAAPAKPAEFVPPAQEGGEDDDDYQIRVSQARKAWKAANGGTPAPQAAKTVVAEPVPAGQEKPASAFGTGAGNLTLDLGGEDDGSAPAAPAAAAAPAKAPPKSRGGAKKATEAKAGEAKAPVEAVQAQGVPSAVEDILGQWGETE